MAEFLLERFVARTDQAAVESDAERARSAAEQLSGEGRRVRFLRTMFVPEEETCFYLFEADAVDDVREAARRAALPAEYVAEAITTRPPRLSHETVGSSRDGE